MVVLGVAQPGRTRQLESYASSHHARQLEPARFTTGAEPVRNNGLTDLRVTVEDPSESQRLSLPHEAVLAPVGEMRHQHG